MSKEKLSWKELKDFANSLPEEVLEQDVKWWGDERGGTLVNTHKLEEDYVCTDEGWEPKSVHESYESYSKEDIEDMPQLAKGTPILWAD